MHDAFLKSVFADRRIAEILIRRHAPEWASEIDLSTLREESTGLAGLMVRSVDTMLELRDYPARLMKGGGKAMAEVVDRFKQGMEELVQKGEVRSMRRQVTRRFGEETAGQLSRLLDKLPGPDEVDRVTDALFECATGDEFIERVRMG